MSLMFRDNDAVNEWIEKNNFPSVFIGSHKACGVFFNKYGSDWESWRFLNNSDGLHYPSEATSNQFQLDEEWVWFSWNGGTRFFFQKDEDALLFKLTYL